MTSNLALFLARAMRAPKKRPRRAKRRYSIDAALDALSRHRSRRSRYGSSDEALGRARKIATVGRYLRDRSGRAGFYYVKNQRGKAVVFWRPRD